MGSPALGDGSPEEALGRRHRHECRAAHAARGLAGDGDLGRIAAESSDVVLHPLQRGDLVEHAEVAGLGQRGEVACQVHEALHAEPVVDRHAHDAITGERCAVVHIVDAAAGIEGAAVDPHQHWHAAGTRVRCPDIQPQAVVASGIGRGAQLAEDARHRLLQCHGAIVGRLTYAVPAGRGCRRLEPQVAHRRCRIRDAFVGMNALVVAPGQPS